MKEPLLTNSMEPRWPAVLAILVTLIILVALPARIRVLPVGVPVTVVILAILPLVGVSLTSANAYWLKVERTVTLLLFTLTLISNSANLVKLIGFMLQHSIEVSGLRLLASGLGVWITNLLCFSLLYWVIDRGGPDARSNNINTRPDWQFPNDNTPAEDKAPVWKPVFVDYLFLSFCTATAFSPTDALPLTARAKLLIMVQSMISLITIVVVLSRAVNILGS